MSDTKLKEINMKPTFWYKAAHLPIKNSRETRISMPHLSHVPLPPCPALIPMTLGLFSIIAIKIWRVKTSPYLIAAAEYKAVPQTTLRSTMNNSNRLEGAAAQITVITRAAIHLLDTAKTTMLVVCYHLTTWTSPPASATRSSASVTNSCTPSLVLLLWTRSRPSSFKKRNSNASMLRLTMR